MSKADYRNSVTQWSIVNHTKVSFEPRSFLLVNSTNWHDQLEPAAKSVWGNPLHSCFIPNHMDLYRTFSILEIHQTTVNGNAP